MYETPGCMWCRQWHAEIGPGYFKSTEGQRALLRTRMLNDQPLPGLSLAAPVTLTPTFVLAENGKEVGCIVGYLGSDFFSIPCASICSRDRRMLYQRRLLRRTN